MTIERKRGKGSKRITRINGRAGTVFKKKVKLKGKQKVRATLGSRTSPYWKLSKK